MQWTVDTKSSYNVHSHDRDCMYHGYDKFPGNTIPPMKAEKKREVCSKIRHVIGGHEVVTPTPAYHGCMSQVSIMSTGIHKIWRLQWFRLGRVRIFFNGRELSSSFES